MNITESDSGVGEDILIVDDTKDNLQLLSDILSDAGYKVRPAGNGELALRSVKAKRPALILLDIKMPGMDGLEVCRQLKTDQETRAIPVIFISGLGDERSKTKGFQAGAVDYITKPFYPEEVLARVKTHLSINRLQLELQSQNAQLLKEIAERKHAEEALSDKKERLAVTLRSIGDAVITTDVNGYVVYLNPVAEKLTGWKQDEAFGKPLTEVFHIINEQTREICSNPAEIVLTTGSIVGLANHTVLISRDGTEYPIADSRAPIHNNMGDVLGVVVIFRDQTKERAVMRDIERQQLLLAAIARGQARFIAENDIASVFEDILSDLLALMDSEYGFIGDVLFSPEGQPYLKTHSLTNIAWNKETQAYYEQNLPAGLEFRNLKTLFGAALISGEPIIANDPLNDPRRGGLPEGHPPVKAFLGIPVCMGGKMLAMAGIANRPGGYDQKLLDFLHPFIVSIAQLVEAFRHRAERKRAEKERENLQEQLRQSQKMEAIGILSAGIAHDFNNLLTTIIGNAELALIDTGKDDPCREIIEEIKGAGERASGLTQQLLAFSRKQTLQPEAINLNDVVNKMENMLCRIIGEDVVLRRELAPDLEQVEADEGQIEQVIMNLVVNAKDAMPKGGNLTIETKNVDLDEHYANAHISVIPGHYVMLAVSDSGTGIAREVQPHIFEPFFTTKEKSKGTGLGLSTVYGIVKQSNGNIWVYSEPGKGTAFKIYLPRCEKASFTPKKAVIREDIYHGSETVLLVEDDEMVRNLAFKSLKRYGYYVLCAPDGQEALRIIREHEGVIHMMLTDMVMPGMSGGDMAALAQGERRDLKVLYMSGYMDSAIVHSGVLDKGISFLQKPFTPDLLAKKVREVLDKR